MKSISLVYLEHEYFIQHTAFKLCMTPDYPKCHWTPIDEKNKTLTFYNYHISRDTFLPVIDTIE
jgi:hypothetical protein